MDRKLRQFTKIAASLIILGGGCYALFTFLSWVHHRVQRLNSIDTAVAFTRAMQRNDIERAKELTDPLLWESLENWKIAHAPVYCKGFSIEATGFVIGGGAVGDPNSHRNSVSINEPCRTEESPERWYCIIANDIVLTRKNNGLWEIITFGEIEESFSRGLC